MEIIYRRFEFVEELCEPETVRLARLANSGIKDLIEKEVDELQDGIVESRD
jgi:hypothetical protein